MNRRIKSRIFGLMGLGLLGLSLAGCGGSNSTTIDISFSDKDKYEGKLVEVVNFGDSAILASATVADGKALVVVEESDSVRFPLFTQITVDGRTRAFVILESGKAVLPDTLSVAQNTPLNERFSRMLSELDSIENLDDMTLYLDYSEKAFNSNRDNPIGNYFGVEYIKYADPQRVDSFLKAAPEDFLAMKKVQQYEERARHRALTAPGMKFTDFDGETAGGKKMSLSSVVKPGKYTLVDFWASWCPYCIKELPDLQQLYADYSEKGLEIVGVAVRDKTEDTANMVSKHSIPWPVVYNTQRVPYDIYGFSGIPHHILIGPDGEIISRGESVAQIRDRITALLPD